jgi:hypothetical protein
MYPVLYGWRSLYRPASYQPVDRKQDYRTQGRYENRPEAYLRNPLAPEEALNYETSYECPRYTDQDSDYDSSGVRPWHNPLGQYAGYEPDHYQRYYAYALSPPRFTTLPPDGTRKRNITDAVPEATNARLTPHPARINTRTPGFVLRTADPATRATRKPARRARRCRRAAGGPRQPCRGRV